jgi:hypothetical protein
MHLASCICILGYHQNGWNTSRKYLSTEVLAAVVRDNFYLLCYNAEGQQSMWQAANRRLLDAFFMVGFCLSYSSALIMMAYSLEKLADFEQTTRNCVPKI